MSDVVSKAISRVPKYRQPGTDLLVERAEQEHLLLVAKDRLGNAKILLCRLSEDRAASIMLNSIFPVSPIASQEANTVARLVSPTGVPSIKKDSDSRGLDPWVDLFVEPREVLDGSSANARNIMRSRKQFAPTFDLAPNPSLWPSRSIPQQPDRVHMPLEPLPNRPLNVWSIFRKATTNIRANASNGEAPGNHRLQRALEVVQDA